MVNTDVVMDNKINSIIVSEDERFCFDIFHRVSLSYANVTEILEEPLRTTVCVFYLILRGLDTIEDEIILDESMKSKALETFSIFLNESSNRPIVREFQFRSECKESYVELMENFDKVLNVFFSRCAKEAQKVIQDIVIEMANGMIKYSARPIDTLTEYNEYCYYAAGLVGVGLTKLFQLNGELCVQQMSPARLEHLAISKGIFIQKVNIIQDISEDLSLPAGRSYYPKEIWQKYVKGDRDLLDENYSGEAIACLNDLINDAFRHLPDVIEYLSLVKHQRTFRFCAIPHCVAVGNLEVMFNNAAVFSSKVRIAPADRAYILKSVIDMPSCLTVLESCLNKFSARADFSSASFDKGTKNWILESVKYVSDYKI